MKTVTRRAGLLMIAGAAAASTLSAPTGAVDVSADPAFAAIAKHRQASADHLASIYAYDWAERGTDAYYDAQDHNEVCCHAARDAAWELAATIPTTLAGVAAVLQYANEVEDEGDEWPDTDTIGADGWHYQLRQAMAAAAANLAA
ncbi:hypothetical protein [Bradyrhizobium brasilense]|uniref:hypothetical protein n=1 Tax=Bradyrhizobium brasilense TaxID=1419277 RepID=UPI001E40656B|nr:hypothetical protein [Bradyrhizobium brasilense]MCC8975749.1 hypothetical protein [Bradyrhizobium brasilense]